MCTRLGEILGLNEICDIWHFELGWIRVDLCLEEIFGKTAKIFILTYSICHKEILKNHWNNTQGTS